MVSISIVSVAGTAILLGIASAMSTSYDAVDRTIANGLAEQLMDEVAGRMYSISGGEYSFPLGGSSVEKAAAGRQYNDIDDFNGGGNGIASEPPVDWRGVTLGTDDGEGGTRHPNFQVADGFFDNWRQEVEVYYVNDSDPSTRLSTGSTSNTRAVEVRILQLADGGAYRELANVRRVFSNVPKP